MARKLPWNETSAPPPKRVRTTPTPRRDSRKRASEEVNVNDADPSEPKKPPSISSRRRARSRTHSTSPPPGPPEIEPMYDGYDGDDLYMMVEDEFQAVAQSFTAHLHHAEYKRLMKKAREAPPKSLPEPLSPMADETKRKLRREILLDKQNQALAKISAAGNDIEDMEEAKVDEPWSGTSLAVLLGSSSQQKTSLVGLEKMSSGTRAAKGFSRIAGDDPDSIKSILQGFPRKPRADGTQKSFDSIRKDEDARPCKGRTIVEEGEKRNESRLLPSKFSDQKQDNYRERGSSTNGSIQQTTVSPIKPPGAARRKPHHRADVPAAIQASQPPTKPRITLKRKMPKKEDQEDRFDEVPLFIL